MVTRVLVQGNMLCILERLVDLKALTKNYNFNKKLHFSQPNTWLLPRTQELLEVDIWCFEKLHHIEVPCSSLEDRAATVESLLEKHIGYGSIFYYRQFYDEPTEENPAAHNGDSDGERDEPPLLINPKGLFGGHLIIAVLASHYKAAYPCGVTPQQIFKAGWVPPEGPLVYSVLAMRALITL
ncbi:hypothetical protein K438DRAFT_1756197 [Mycena galopus ATCC 62051]|nr:hypothetical protein K438DRAFT_1756197 [Mycena galopus ATCC 62051]